MRRDRENVVPVGQFVHPTTDWRHSLLITWLTWGIGLAVCGGIIGSILLLSALSHIPVWLGVVVAAPLGILALGHTLHLGQQHRRRVNDLSRAVRLLGFGRFDNELETTAGDELGELAGTINVAAKQISKRELDRVHEKERLENLMRQMSHDLRSNTEDYLSLKQQSSRLDELREVGERVRDARNEFDLVRRLVDAFKFFEVAEAYVLRNDAERRELDYVGVYVPERGINATGRTVAHAVLPEVNEADWLALRAIKRGRPVRGTGRGVGELRVIHEFAAPANGGGRTQAVIWIRQYGEPVNDDDARDISFLAKAAGDAFESLRLYQEEQNRQAAEKVDRMKSELIATVSHELRTPLVSIKGFAETLLTDPDADDETRREYLEIIIDEGEKLEELISNLLDMSRLEAGMLRIDPRPIPLTRLVARVVTKTRSRAAVGGYTLQMNFPPDLPLVSADAARLEQVIRNLIENAIKYSPEGGKILIYAEPDGDAVRVSVRDHGIGIAPEHLDLIFDRFYRVDNSMTRGTSGTGIGLSICRGLVEAHQGRIWAESVPNEGTTFNFTLPIAQRETDDELPSVNVAPSPAQRLTEKEDRSAAAD